MSMSSEKSLVRPHFCQKIFLLLYRREKSTPWKGTLSQAVGGSLRSTVWYFCLLSGMQRAIPEGNAATLGSSTVKAQVGSSAKKIVFLHWRAACYLRAGRHKPWCFFSSTETYPFSQTVKRRLITLILALTLMISSGRFVLPLRNSSSVDAYKEVLIAVSFPASL